MPTERESLVVEARNAWRDAFYLVTGVRDGGYAPPEVREEAVRYAVELAKDLDEQIEAGS